MTLEAAHDPRSARLGRLHLAFLPPVLAALLLAFVIVRDDVRLFHPHWILHPDETGMLFIGKHLAQTGSFIVEDDWYLQSPAHVPEGVSEAKGRLVPQKAPLGYVVYAGAFLISDDAWRFVTPLFGLLAAGAAGWIVLEKTRNRWAALAATLALASSSPVIVYASGLAFVDVIALAGYLLAVIAFRRYLASGSRWAAVGVGLALGAATLTRYDFFVAGVLALGVALWHRHREAPLRTKLWRALPGIGPFGLLLTGAAAMNWWLYGSPFTTGYEPGSWQTSPGGVGRSLFDFSPAEFARLSWNYLVQIGLSCTLLLVFGTVAKLRLRRWDATDGLLFGCAGFGLLYFLGKEGAYGSQGSWLVSSYPRYLLPVYAAGAIVGTEGAFLALRRLRWEGAPVAAGLMAVGLIAVTIGAHEAWSNPRGVLYAEKLTLRHALLRDVVERTPYPVLVSDLSSKAVVDDYTITPRRLADPEAIVTYVSRELQARRHVLLTHQADHPLYSGYVERLQAAGYQLIVRRRNPLVYEIENPVLRASPERLREGRR